MSEGIVAQIKEAPKKLFTAPVMFLVIGLIFTAVMMIIEVNKPGIITDKVRKALTKLGLMSATKA